MWQSLHRQKTLKLWTNSHVFWKIVNVGVQNINYCKQLVLSPPAGCLHCNNFITIPLVFSVFSSCGSPGSDVNWLMSRRKAWNKNIISHDGTYITILRIVFILFHSLHMINKIQCLPLYFDDQKGWYVARGVFSKKTTALNFLLHRNKTRKG